MKFEPMDIEEEMGSFYIGTYLPSGSVRNLIKFLTEHQKHEIEVENDEGSITLKASKWREETLEEAKERAMFELKRQKEYLKAEVWNREKYIKEIEEFLNENQ